MDSIILLTIWSHGETYVKTSSEQANKQKNLRRVDDGRGKDIACMFVCVCVCKCNVAVCDIERSEVNLMDLYGFLPYVLRHILSRSLEVLFLLAWLSRKTLFPISSSSTFLYPMSLCASFIKVCEITAKLLLTCEHRACSAPWSCRSRAG